MSLILLHMRNMVPVELGFAVSCSIDAASPVPSARRETQAVLMPGQPSGVVKRMNATMKEKSPKATQPDLPL